jgi:hypothetical protein
MKWDWTNKFRLIFAILTVSVSFAFGELQTTLTMTTPVLAPGASGSFTATQASGGAASTTSTLYNPYANILQYQLSPGTGRFASISGNRYGLQFDTFQIFQSFLTPNFFTVVSSGTSCPAASNYTWLLVRYRSPDAPTGAMDAYSVNSRIGGTLAYNPSSSPQFTSSSAFDLAGPNTYGTSYNFDSSPWGGCASGVAKVQNTSYPPLDNLGRFFFGNTMGIYVGGGGNPTVATLMPQQTLTAGIMTGLANQVLSGIYTTFDTISTQTQQNIFMFPDAAGTTFTLKTVNNLADPTNTTTYGTLACTTLNSPYNGFCKGTLTISGMAGSSNVVCQLGSTSTQDVLSCSFAVPNAHTKGGSIIATRSNTAVLSVSTPSTATSAAPGGSSTVVATLQNLTGSYISTMANPAIVAQQLSAPFSNPGAYTGAGGTCGSTLKGYSSCTLNITYSPSAVGTTMQVFRVAYNNQSSTVNATSGVVGASGLVSITVSPNQSGFANGTSQQFTAIATYSDGSTQNVTNAVLWSSNATSVASITSGGNASFLTTGTPTISATLAGVTGSTTPTIYNPPPNPTGLGAVATNYTTVTLNWTSGGGSTVGFQVAYQLGSTAPSDCNSGTVISSGIIGAATTYGVTGLLAGSTYSFRVCAAGAVAGTYSTGVTVTQATD